MAALARSKASLRIFGDHLVPDEMTTLLGHEPSKAHIKGEKIPIGNASKHQVATTGGWLLSAPEAKPGDFDTQIDFILSKLTSDLAIWDKISKKYRIDLFCGLFKDEEMEGIAISADCLSKLGDRQILIDLDIYGPVEE